MRIVLNCVTDANWRCSPRLPMGSVGPFSPRRYGPAIRKGCRWSPQIHTSGRVGTCAEALPDLRISWRTVGTGFVDERAASVPQRTLSAADEHVLIAVLDAGAFSCSA